MLTKLDHRSIESARHISARHSAQTIVGAVVVSDNKIMSAVYTGRTGFPSGMDDCRMCDVGFKMKHAEMNAIFKAEGDICSQNGTTDSLN